MRYFRAKAGTGVLLEAFEVTDQGWSESWPAWMKEVYGKTLYTQNYQAGLRLDDGSGIVTASPGDFVVTLSSELRSRELYVVRKALFETFFEEVVP